MARQLPHQGEVDLGQVLVDGVRILAQGGLGTRLGNSGLLGGGKPVATCSSEI